MPKPPSPIRPGDLELAEAGADRQHLPPALATAPAPACAVRAAGIAATIGPGSPSSSAGFEARRGGRITVRVVFGVVGGQWIVSVAGSRPAPNMPQKSSPASAARGARAVAAARRRRHARPPCAALRRAGRARPRQASAPMPRTTARAPAIARVDATTCPGRRAPARARPACSSRPAGARSIGRRRQQRASSSSSRSMVQSSCSASSAVSSRRCSQPQCLASRLRRRQAAASSAAMVSGK